MNLLEGSPKHHRQNRLLRHVAFWAIFVIIIAAGVGHFQETPFLQSLFGTLVWLPYQMGVAYVLLYGIIPQFLQKNIKRLFCF